MKISIETIPHQNQLYDTVGNYFEDESGITIQVSEMGNPDYEFLVALHEMVEMWLCKKRGIKFEDIDEFDIKFESLRGAAAEIIAGQEPGDMAAAPYYQEHQIATRLERIAAVELGVNWAEYDKAVQEL